MATGTGTPRTHEIAGRSAPEIMEERADVFEFHASMFERISSICSRRPRPIRSADHRLTNTSGAASRRPALAEIPDRLAVAVKYVLGEMSLAAPVLPHCCAPAPLDDVMQFARERNRACGFSSWRPAG
jgi:hypothetical protein